MFIKGKKFIFLLLFLSGVFLAGSFALAQATPLQQAQDQKAQLQQQLQAIENQIAQYQQELSQIQGEKNTLQNKINQLKKQQATLSLKIQATTLQINGLENQISVTQASIDQNTAKAASLQEQMSGLLRLINEQDGYPFLYTLVSQGSLSGVLNEVQNYTQISESLRNLLNQTLQTKMQLTLQKQNLTQQEQDANNLLSIQSLQQQQLAGSVSEQNVLLEQTKGKESDYQITLNDTQRRANEIRSRLYQLLGVSQQITFGEAVQIAQWASGQSGVRAAFLLAILTQESNLGQNVGTCNRPGDPPNKSWRAVMKPDRDQQPFLQITSELGLDPDITPVSCPMRDKRGNQVGWGGAMGPAQFIPSTWLGYKDQVAAATGKTANPWDIRDAFLAAAIKLASNGATSLGGEWAAAMRYFSGGTNSRYRFYGDNVVAIAAQYQNDISDLNK